MPILSPLAHAVPAARDEMELPNVGGDPCGYRFVDRILVVIAACSQCKRGCREKINFLHCFLVLI